MGGWDWRSEARVGAGAGGCGGVGCAGAGVKIGSFGDIGSPFMYIIIA